MYRITLFFITFLFNIFSASAAIIYVNQNATNGNNNGSSWNNAFVNLQLALQHSQANDTIWVAKGIYFPTIESNPKATFFVPTSVALFGGFSGNENSLSERELSNNETILEGKINENTNIYSIITLINPSSNNQVDGFTIRGGKSQILAEDQLSVPLEQYCGAGIFVYSDTTTGFEKFQVTNCVFTNNTAIQGSGIYVNATHERLAISVTDCLFENNGAFHGSGLWIKNNNTDTNWSEIKRCEFIENKGIEHRATGVVGTSFSVTSLHLLIENCNFKNNFISRAINLQSAVTAMGKVVIRSCDFINNGWISTDVGTGVNTLFGRIELTIEESTFLDNGVRDYTNIFLYAPEVKTFGGALALRIRNGVSNPPKFIIRNCSFFNNQADYGGAIYGFSPMKIVNCEFYNNYAGIDGETFYMLNHVYPYTLEVNNCTFVNHNSSGNFFASSDSTASELLNNIVFKNSIIYENSQKFGYLNHAQLEFDHVLTNIALSDSTFRLAENEWTSVSYDSTTYWESIPLFKDTANHDFSLLPCSPGVDIGKNELAYSDTDLAGQNRIQGNKIDMGAYENFVLNAAINAKQPVTCNNLNNGQVEIDIEDARGIPLIRFANQVTTQTTIDDLAVGSYEMTITDDTDCPQKVVFDIEQGEALQISSEVNNNLCHADKAASIQINTTGGVEPYRYLWSDGSTERLRTNLVAGDYSLTITDNTECQIVATYTITAPDPIQVSGAITNATNGETNNGAIEITSVTGGTPPYDLSWNNDMTGASLTDLPIGDYVLTVTDSLGCQFRTGFAVSVNVATDELPTAEDLLRIQPNPTTGWVQIEFLDAAVDFQTVQLFNVVGQAVLKQEVVEKNRIILNLNHLPNGVYLLQLNHEIDAVTTRLLKQ